MKPGEVIEPALPGDCAHVWQWFSDLLLTRQIGMGDNPITYSEIDAYCRLTDTRMEPWEARALIEAYWTFRGALPGKGNSDLRNETDVSDAAGIKALMSDFVSQQKPAKGRKAKKVT